MENIADGNKIIGGFLDIALDVEDQMSEDVYGEFLKKSAWPENLEKEVFQAVKTSLMILIKETEEHRAIFLELKEKLEKHEN